MKFEIEKGVPMRGRSHGRRYPFADMAVGDSFLEPYEGEAPTRVQQRVASAAWHWGRRHGRKFASRSLANGVRVWRVQ